MVHVNWTTEVDVDIDLKELVDDLTDDELAEVGLMRAPEGWVPPTSPEHDLASPGLKEHLWAVKAARTHHTT